MTNIAVVGCGYWGPNLARNIHEMGRAHLYALCDRDEAARGKMSEQYPNARLFDDTEQVWRDENVDAVIIATPVATHFPLAAAALSAGKHVLIEKPMASSVQECEQLIRLADEKQRVLMVGHTFLYNAAVRYLKRLIDSGELGRMYYLYSQRLNLGIVRQNVNVLWNLAPHDISMLSYLLGKTPLCVSARGLTYLQEGVPDIVFMQLDFPEGIAAHVHLSWLDPGKVRQVTAVGSQKMAVYDDVSTDAKIQLFDKGIDAVDRSQSIGTWDSFGEFQLLVRSGDRYIPRLSFTEPLRGECEEFIDSIVERRQALSSGQNGLEVVRVLEAAQRSLESDGALMEVPG